MRLLILGLAFLMVGCAANPGDEMIRLSGSNMQVDVMQTSRVLKEHPEVVKYANSHGTTALHAAAGVWNYPVVANLVNAGADPNARDKDGNTPLHKALGAIEAMNQGASENLPGTPLNAEQREARDKLQTGVVLTQMRNREDVVRFLLARKADVTIKNNEGKTPLEYSIQSREVYDDLMAQERGRQLR